MPRKKAKPYFLRTPKSPKKIQFPFRFVKFLFLFIIFGFLAYIFLCSPYFNVQKLDIKGSKNESISDYLQTTKGKNLWLLNKKKLEDDLLKYPEISRVSIRKWPPQTLKVEIVEKTEGIVWQTQGKKYLLDTRGFAIKEVGESSLPQVIDTKNAPMEIDKQVGSAAFVNFVKNLNFKFTPKTSLPLKEISVPEETTLELIVQTEGFKVIFDTQEDLDQQLDNMIRVYQIKKDAIKEYMDLRIQGRVYYK